MTENVEQTSIVSKRREISAKLGSKPIYFERIERAVRDRSVNIDNENFQIRMFPSDMRVNVRRLFTSLLTVGTLKSWLLSALVSQMSGQTRLLAEGTRAIRAWKPLCLGIGKCVRIFDSRLYDDADAST